VVAVLVVGWTRDVREITPRQGSVITLLADEAAVAIERSDMVAQLAALARTDPLTGLANRRVWEERLPIEIARAQRTREPLGLLVVDLDDFKAVNDEYGHQAGDRMLKEVAAAWRDVIRPTDLLARFGGDEFVVLASGCSAEVSMQLAERLRRAMPGDLTCSVGVVEWSGDEPSGFMTRGDRALYEAKRSRRACGHARSSR
jgi:diguanylate cyclase (GGDEF)-like protein